MSLQIKIASVADAQLISDLSKQTFYEAFYADNTKEDMDLFLAENFNLKETIDEFENGLNTFYTVCNEDEVFGYATLRESKNAEDLIKVKSILLARIYLLNKHIGKGAGKLLMQQCISEATLRGNQIIWLTVWERNPRAIEFYTSFGFAKFGEEKFVLGNDVQNDWMMMKEL